MWQFSFCYYIYILQILTYIYVITKTKLSHALWKLIAPYLKSGYVNYLETFFSFFLCIFRQSWTKLMEYLEIFHLSPLSPITMLRNITTTFVSLVYHENILFAHFRQHWFGGEGFLKLDLGRSIDFCPRLSEFLKLC